MDRRSFVLALLGLIGFRSVASASAAPVWSARSVLSNTSTRIEFVPEFTISADDAPGTWLFSGNTFYGGTIS
jgi:hypothetical protein